MTKQLAIVLLSTLGVANAATGQTLREPQTLRELFGMRDTLKGASPVWVWATVETRNLDETTERLLANNGIRTDSLNTRIELRLRSAGIPVVSQKEEVLKSFALPGAPTILSVSVTPGCIDVDNEVWICAVAFTVKLFQRAIITRNSVKANVATWSSDGGAIAGSRRLNDVWHYLEELLDDFANDWLAANPRR